MSIPMLVDIAKVALLLIVIPVGLASAAIIALLLRPSLVRKLAWAYHTRLCRYARFVVRPAVWLDRWLRRGSIRRWAVWPYRVCAPPVTAFAFLVCWALAYVYLWPGDKPDTRTILEYEPLQIGHLYDATGTVYYRSFNNEARVVVPYDQIPEHVRNAFVAAEDGDYWGNDGWDKERTLVATVKASSSKLLRTRYRPQGASGITQQVMRKLDPITADLARREKDPTLISRNIPTRIVSLIQGPVFANRTARKWREIKRSVNLESALEEHFKKAGAQNPKRTAKEAILGTYLNEAFFGNGVYGVAYAARFYFQKDLKDITVPEAAYLASLLPAPVRYAKLDGDRAAAKSRRDEVQRRMAKEGFIKDEELEVAQAVPLGLNVQVAKVKTEAAAAVNTVLFHELPDVRESREKLLRGGIQVHTTLRMDLQRPLNRAAHRGIYGDGKKAAPGKKKPETGFAERYPGAELPQVSAAFLGVNGEVLALYGGEVREARYQYRAEQQLNRALSEESPGSTIKIVNNMAALAVGFTPDTLISDADISVCMRKGNDGNCAEWKPIGNYEAEKLGVLPLWEWSARSVNTPYMRLMKDMVGNTPEAKAEADALEVILDKEAGHNVGNIDPGAAWMLKWAKEMGIRTPLRPYISSVLGGSEVTVLDMANVIRTAGTGNRAVPYIISRITDNNGKDLYTNDGQLTPLPVTPEQKFQLQALLYNNVRNPEGTGHSLDTVEFGIEVAGKTGTSDDWRDAWYCGYVPDMLYGCVHVGYDNNKPMPGEGLHISRAASGGWVALPIWRYFVEQTVGHGKPLGAPNKMPDQVKEMVNEYLARRTPSAAK